MSLTSRIFLKACLFTTATTLLLTSTSNADTTATSPESKNSAIVKKELKKELSTLNVSIQASAEDLANTLNRMVPQALYKGATNTKGLTADIVRNGAISVTSSENYIYMTLPISITLKTAFFQAPPITSKLKFKMGAKVTPDWKLNTELYYMGLSDLVSENIGIGPVSVKPRSIIDGVTQPVQRIVSDLIAKKLNEKFPLKEQVAKVWSSVQKPILLDKNYSAWLRLAPQEVLLDPLYAQNNQVKLNVGIKSFADLVVGPEPPAQTPVQLPNLTLSNGMDQTFRIALNTELFYKDVLAIASPMLLNKELGSDGKSIIIKEFDLYGSDDKLMIKATMTGTLEGTFYLKCRPAFDMQTNMFSVEDVEFDMENTSFLLRAANWLMHGTIRNIIKEKLNVDLTQRLVQAKEMAGKSLEKVRLADNIFLSGNVKTVKLRDVMVQKDRLSIQLYTEGETSIVLR